MSCFGRLGTPVRGCVVLWSAWYAVDVLCCAVSRPSCSCGALSWLLCGLLFVVFSRSRPPFWRRRSLLLVLLAAACVVPSWALPSRVLLVGASGACGWCSFARGPPSAPSSRVASFSSPRVLCAFIVAPVVLWWCCVVLVLCVACELGTPVPWLWWCCAVLVGGWRVLCQLG